MATYKHLRSSTANKRPTTSIADGQLAINTNTASPGLFFKDSAGTGIVKVGPVHVGTTAPNSVPASGGSTGNYLGEQWLDTSVSPAQMKVWNGSAWIGVVADELPVSKLQDGTAGQIVQTDSAGTGVEWSSTANLPAGSASVPAYRFQGDANTGLYSPGADQVAISTGGTGRLFVDSSGRVGVGVSSPVAKIHSSAGSSSVTPNASADELFLENNGNVGLQFGCPNTGNARISFGDPEDAQSGLIFYDHATNHLRFDTAATERARIDSSGRLLVGTSISPSAGLGQYARLVVQGYVGGSNNLGTVSIQRGTDPYFAGAGLGRITFDSNSGNTYGSIDCFVDGTPGEGDYPGRLMFSTTADGASSPTERMRIDSSGRVGIGTNSATELLSVNGNLWLGNGGGSGGSEMLRIWNDGGVERIHASNNPSALAFGIGGSAGTNEAFRVDTNKRLLVGTSSTSLSNKFALQGDTSGANNGGYMRLQTASSVVSGTSLGSIGFGDTANNGALIEAKGDVSWSPFTKGSRLEFSTTADSASSPTERMRINSSGNVGIGTTSPGQSWTGGAANVLEVNQGTAGNTTVLRLRDTATSGTSGDVYLVSSPSATATLGNVANGPLTFYINTGEAARFDSSKRLLVGTSSSASAGNSQYAKLQVQGNTVTDSAIVALRRGQPATSIVAGDVLGDLEFADSAGNPFAQILGVADGTAGSGDYPGRLVFSTTADSASSPTERMRINQDGAVWVGSTTGTFDSSNHGFGILTTSSVVGALRQSSNQSSTGSTARFYGTAGAAYIQGDGDLENTNNRYTGISDIKYKQNIEDASSQWDDIKAIQVRKYELIANPDRKHIGVVAQELEQVCPGLVIERNEDDDGTETYKSVAYSILYMKAVKALQEAMERIEQLEAKVNALEGN